MNEKSLLEDAAKAVGLRVHVFSCSDESADALLCDEDGKPIAACPWRPHTDDGDAMRLAVALRLLAAEDRQWTEYYGEEIADGKGELEAHRRAFVRAAAAIWHRSQGA